MEDRDEEEAYEDDEEYEDEGDENLYIRYSVPFVEKSNGCNSHLTVSFSNHTDPLDEFSIYAKVGNTRGRIVYSQLYLNNRKYYIPNASSYSDLIWHFALLAYTSSVSSFLLEYRAYCEDRTKTTEFKCKYEIPNLFNLISIFLLNNENISDEMVDELYDASFASIDRAVQQKKQTESPTAFIVDNKTYNIGDKYEGGIIVWINETADGGLICSENDLPQKGIFGYGKDDYSIWSERVWEDKKDKDSIGAGLFNTNYIIKYFNEDNNTAAYYCKNANINGYNDWFLPSYDEMKYLTPYLTKGHQYLCSSSPDHWKKGITTPKKYKSRGDFCAIRPVRTFGTFSEDGRIEEAVKDVQKRKAEREAACYIATCVYGSYDCPEVWTLRRFRDNTLDTTWYGRMFIKTYYAISPTLVKWFGSTKGFKKIWKIPIDKLVNLLQNQGFENSPYNDKY